MKNFTSIRIKLASPLKILKWSYRKNNDNKYVGLIQTPLGLDKDTLLPCRNGIFCDQIFGPITNYECVCGKYKSLHCKNISCDVCGVEINDSKLRSHRMGCIKLLYPVTHFWYLKSFPNIINLLLEINEISQTIRKPKNFNHIEILNEKDIRYFSIYNYYDFKIKSIHISAIIYGILENDFLDFSLHWELKQYRFHRNRGFDFFMSQPNFLPLKKDLPNFLLNSIPYFLTGSSLLYKELKILNLNSELHKTKAYLFLYNTLLYKNLHSIKGIELKRLKKLRKLSVHRIRILENLIGSGSNPSWMILTLLPVIPPTLRALVQLEGGKFITSELNQLYQTIISRNIRLYYLIKLNSPWGMIKQNKRLLQEAVDSLIDNKKSNQILLNSNNQPLKSLSDIIKGKYGRLRQDLLGKRVNFSGRSVIIVEPKLKLVECGLPYNLAIELFKFFIVTELNNSRKHLKNPGLPVFYQENIFKFKKTLIIPILNKLFKNYPIFINRAPTLHRLGVQAFKPVLISGKAIKIHPLVCTAFNADFDGDQMAIHIPISLESKMECYTLMLSSNNLLSPSNKNPIITPSQDMVLGFSYLTLNNIKNLDGANHYFINFEDALLAYHQNKLELHSSIWIKINHQLIRNLKLIKIIKLKNNTFIEHYNNFQIHKLKNGKILSQYLKTTIGKIILNYTLNQSLLNL
uniref:DNA-directed RNA polymerase subunit n=1 Tax=Nitzschia sp. (in: diatoms) TaxID=1884248 RepID=A0A5J6DUE2_9STRA|nr:RNA polymerase b'-subunit [Nitzschia sp. (in: diatoms)]